MSFTESLLVFNDQRWQPLIRDVLCQSTALVTITVPLCLYQLAVSFTNPQLSITDPQKEEKNCKYKPKKSPKPKKIIFAINFIKFYDFVLLNKSRSDSLLKIFTKPGHRHIHFQFHLHQYLMFKFQITTIIFFSH